MESQLAEETEAHADLQESLQSLMVVQILNLHRTVSEEIWKLPLAFSRALGRQRIAVVRVVRAARREDLLRHGREAVATVTGGVCVFCLRDRAVTEGQKNGAKRNARVTSEFSRTARRNSWNYIAPRCSHVAPWTGPNCEINAECPDNKWTTHLATVETACFHNHALIASNLPAAGECSPQCTAGINYFFSTCSTRLSDNPDRNIYNELHTRCQEQPQCAGGDTFADRSRRMAKVCCPDDAENDCNPAPTICSAECAPEFGHFITDCGSIVQAQPFAGALEQFLQTCQAASASPPPSPADPVCDSGNSFSTMAQQVFAACCPDNSDDCNPLPAECSAECQGEFPNFFGDCAVEIQNLDNYQDMQAFLEVCNAPPSPPPVVTPPAPPPPATVPPPPPADPDACADSDSPCNALHMTCTNTDGSFACGDCASGYHDSGKVSITGSSCVPNSCTHGLTIAHSDRVPTNQCHGATGDECTYVCDSGYAKPPGTAGKHVCGVDGTYTGGVCHQLSCSAAGDNGLAFDHTEVVYSHSRINGKNTQVAYVDCLAGWQATGAPTMTVPHGDSEQTYAFTCGEDGKWSPQFAGLLPQTSGMLCSAVQFTCAALPPTIPHGHVSYSPLRGGQATVSCVNGAFFSGSMDRTMQMHCDKGEWDPPMPTCQLA
eukprot:COSAG06_NODE_2654_length_6488_cov_4.182658_1_plen_660_part_00